MKRTREVGPEAVWPVSRAMLTRAVEKACDDAQGKGVDGPFLEVMEGLGAGPAALRFSASLETAAYLHAFQEAGPVDVGWVHYPFRANERFGCYLLNGNPGLLDVDDPAIRPEKALKERARTSILGGQAGEITVWPGDRLGPGRVAVSALPDGGIRFIAGYVLRDGCHACDLLGSAEIAFDFDDKGGLLGSEVASMGKVIHTAVGGRVTLSLEAPSKEPGRWQAFRLPSPDILRLESKAHVPARSGRDKPSERWTFEALAPGRVLLNFRCVPAGPPKGLSSSLASFLVVVHEDRKTMNAFLHGVFAPVVERRLEEMKSPRAGRVVMDVVGVHGDVARVDIRPRNPESDDWAVVYLRWVKGDWGVLSVARDFEADFYLREGIPLELRGPLKRRGLFAPLAADVCSSLRDVLSGALQRQGTLEERVPFEDPTGKGSGDACRITWTGTGETFEGLPQVSRSIRALLVEKGWSEDVSCAADGPLGTAAGFRKDGALILVRVIVEPDEGAGLLSNRPVSLWELLPEEWNYTITLSGVIPPSF